MEQQQVGQNQLFENQWTEKNSERKKEILYF